MTTKTTFMDRFTEQTKGLSHISTGGYLAKCDECRHLIGEDGFGGEDVLYTETKGFSWSVCDTCGSTLGGDREVGHAIYEINPILGEGLLHLNCCTDCVVWLANGDLPEGDD